MTTVNAVPPVARSYWTMGRGNNERAFRTAQRHSRIVRFLRIALPALIAIATVGITLSTYFNPLASVLPVKVGSVVVSGSKITMDHPHMTGFTRDARAYEMNADAAVQDLTKPNMIELQNIDAKVQMQDRSTVNIKAPKGLYDSKKELLQLDHSILITSTNGYQGRLKEATVDIRKGDVDSDKPVEMQMLQGTLNANRLKITDSGDLIRFDRGVRMTLMLSKHALAKALTTDNPNGGGAQGAGNAQTRNTPDRLVVTPLPRADPRPRAPSASAPSEQHWVRLPPRDPRRFNELAQGTAR